METTVDFLNALDAVNRNWIEICNLFDAAELMVNSFSFNPEPVAEKILSDPHRRNVMEAIAVHYIHYWGAEAEDWMSDGRNEIAVERCKKIAGMAEFESPYLLWKDDWTMHHLSNVFVEQTKKMHRTLMQTFTGLLFCCIANSETPGWKNISTRMSDEAGDRWYKLPLI